MRATSFAHQARVGHSGSIPTSFQARARTTGSDKLSIFTQIIDDGEDEHDEDNSHDDVPKTVHYGLNRGSEKRG